MAKVKATGYPTYIIIKKDGSYKQAATRYPVNVQAMIKEIEAAGV
jgi:protein-disulfide isomerase-like protein with CxxC motif